MNSYIEASLAKNEQILSIFEFHWIVYVKPTLKCILVAAVFSALTYFWEFNAIALAIAGALMLFFGGVPFLKVYSTEMGVTNKRVIYKSGVISRNTEEMRISSIETVEVRQSIFQRLLNLGTVKITGKGVSDLVLVNLSDPMSVKVDIENALPTPQDQEE